MDKKIIAVAALAFLCLGYVAAHAQGAGDYSQHRPRRFPLMRPKWWERVICFLTR